MGNREVFVSIDSLESQVKDLNHLIAIFYKIMNPSSSAQNPQASHQANKKPSFSCDHALASPTQDPQSYPNPS